MKKKIICFDLDNVICKTKKNFYHQSVPIKKSIDLVNELYDKGYYIKIFTARGMGTYKGKKNIIKNKLGKLTLLQLKDWNVKYNELILFKPSYDIFIDDKAIGFNKNWQKLVKRKLNIR
tara:strand:- start:282 stop:638 length:357 start_codon:yes stop_codon:yes gene_type:complete